MFNRITPRYDLLNRLMSAGQDIRWRKHAINILGDLNYSVVLDLCCGSGDFIFLFDKKYRDNIKIYGIDFSEEMLTKSRKRHLTLGVNHIQLCQADALSLPLNDNSIDAVTIGFGIRNIPDRPAALQEISRVLKPGGGLIILEPAFPQNALLRVLFKFYFKIIMPSMGGIISGDYKAYKYLNDSAETFPKPDKFLGLMKEAGFTNTKIYLLTLGIAVIYHGKLSTLD
jgi:demethylmenaquinone methyltransferase/2-methoxy-6-polyprenyl-1,4-benzoquinol methylase